MPPAKPLTPPPPLLNSTPNLCEPTIPPPAPSFQNKMAMLIVFLIVAAALDIAGMDLDNKETQILEAMINPDGKTAPIVDEVVYNPTTRAVVGIM